MSLDARTQAGERLHVRVEGRVQGVGFRWFVQQRAAALGLRGWVRNRADGSVEVLATGAPAALRALEDVLREGPPHATVRALVPLGGDPSAEPLPFPFDIRRDAAP